jgi:hypothetical protein
LPEAKEDNMQFQEMFFTCDACPRGDDGRLKICQIKTLWFSPASGRLLIEATCPECGRTEECPISSMDLIADFEEGQSMMSHLVEAEELIM